MDARQKALESAIEKHRKAAVAICEGAELGSRLLTTEERAACDKHITAIKSYGAELAAARSVEQKAGKLMDSATSTGSDLLALFETKGWQPGSRTSVEFENFKTATFSGDVADVNPTSTSGPPLGFDARWLHEVFPRRPVASTATSVSVLKQSGRTLASASEMRRELAAITPKPETSSEMELEDLPLEQIASVQTNTPNIILAQSAFRQMVNTDLALAYSRALDAMVAGEIALEASVSPPGSDLLQSVRAAITAVQSAGYNPRVLALSPSDAEDLDLMQSEGTEAFYIFGPGSFASSPFRLRTVVSPAVDDPLVIDPSASAILYASPVSLASFEEEAGQTNSSTVRLEGTATIAVQRAEAVARIGT